MFENKTAWFSASCQDNAKKIWAENRGKLEDVSLAQYVFSDNWDHDDTKVLLDSDAYLRQHLAVFSSQYVVDAVGQGIDHVSLGKYFLVPSSIKDNIHNRRIQAKDERHKHNTAYPLSKNAQPKPSKGTKSKTRQKENEGDSLASSVLSSSDVSLSEKSLPILHHVQNHDSRQIPNNQLKVQKLTSTALAPQRSSCGISATATTDSIPHIKSLPKVISCLRTIYPGKDGVEVRPIT